MSNVICEDIAINSATPRDVQQASLPLLWDMNGRQGANVEVFVPMTTTRYIAPCLPQASQSPTRLVCTA